MQDGGARATQRSWTVYLQTGERKQNEFKISTKKVEYKVNVMFTRITVIDLCSF